MSKKINYYVIINMIGGKKMKKYKIVEGPKNIIVDKKNSEAALKLFEDIINKEVSQGWEYHSMETITITEKPGCFQQPISRYSYMLIFYKEER